jgi:hypothetical protein
MTHCPYFSLFIALLLIVLSWWGIVKARTGLVMRSLERQDVSHTYFALFVKYFYSTGGLVEQPEVSRTRLALLGHSMGSGAVMSTAISVKSALSL